MIRMMLGLLRMLLQIQAMQSQRRELPASLTLPIDSVPCAREPWASAPGEWRHSSWQFCGSCPPVSAVGTEQLPECRCRQSEPVEILPLLT